MQVKPPTGEPDAGKPPVRFGGGRDRDNRSFLPLYPAFGGAKARERAYKRQETQTRPRLIGPERTNAGFLEITPGTANHPSTRTGGAWDAALADRGGCLASPRSGEAWDGAVADRGGTDRGGGCGERRFRGGYGPGQENCKRSGRRIGCTWDYPLLQARLGAFAPPKAGVAPAFYAGVAGRVLISVRFSLFQPALASLP